LGKNEVDSSAGTKTLPLQKKKSKRGRDASEFSAYGNVTEEYSWEKTTGKRGGSSGM